MPQRTDLPAPLQSAVTTLPSIGPSHASGNNWECCHEVCLGPTLEVGGWLVQGHAGQSELVWQANWLVDECGACRYSA